MWKPAKMWKQDFCQKFLSDPTIRKFQCIYVYMVYLNTIDIIRDHIYLFYCILARAARLPTDGSTRKNDVNDNDEDDGDDATKQSWKKSSTNIYEMAE